MIRPIWHALKYLRATTVRSREELDTALMRTPRYIRVEGTEALRAYAASLAYRGGQEAAALEVAAPSPTGAPVYMVVPTVGRIRDGYRHRPHHEPHSRRTAGRMNRLRLQAGMGTVVAALAGLLAALMVEWLSWPSSNPELVRGPHHAAAIVPRGVVIPLPTHAPPPPPLTLAAQITQILIPVLIAAALAALAFLAWQAIGPGRPVRITWRVDHRVPGLLVIRRIRTRIA